MQNKQNTVTIPLQEYEHLQSEVAYFKQQLVDLKRMIFGKSSERFIPSESNQLPLFGATETVVETTPETEQINYERKKNF